jgi:transposase
MARPTSKFVQELSQSDVKYLHQMWKEHPSYVARCRAHAVLLSARGYSIAQIQDVFAISKPTALAWIDRWEERGREGLEDEPRTGRPPILDEQERDLFTEELKRFPREPKKVIQAIREKVGKSISRATLRRQARKLGYRWKRFRKSLRERCNEEKRRAAMEEIQSLRSECKLDLAYFDESAFSLKGVVPYGWQPVGHRDEVTVANEGGNVQVLGILEESGHAHGYLHVGRVYGTTVAEVLDHYSLRITRPTVLILDNASVHTAGVVVDQMEVWNSRGLFFYFLPPHCSELNDIERFWKKIKYQKLPTDAWQRLSSLVLKQVTLRWGLRFFR